MNGYNNLLSYLTIFVLTLLIGCAPLVPSPPVEPLSREQTTYLISHMRAQGDKVFSFLGVGKLRFKQGEEESVSNLLAVGYRPFRVRLEITHSWGKPLFYIVADKRNISVLSLAEHKFYSGPPSHLYTRQFFLFDLDLDSAWMILSGRVPILPHHRAISLKPNEITLFNWQDEVVEIISFFSSSLLPRSVHFPKRGLTILLSRFKEGALGRYPSKIIIAKGDENQLEIQYKSLQLNKTIPEEIFRLDPPPDFEIIQAQ